MVKKGKAADHWGRRGGESVSLLVTYRGRHSLTNSRPSEFWCGVLGEMWVQVDSSMSDMKNCWVYSISTSSVGENKSNFILTKYSFKHYFIKWSDENRTTIQYNTDQPSINPQAKEKWRLKRMCELLYLSTPKGGSRWWGLDFLRPFSFSHRW